MVIAIPMALVVQGHGEQVILFQPLQAGLVASFGASWLQNGLAQWTAHPVEDRGSEEKVHDARLHLREHLTHQVICQLAVAFQSVEIGDCAVDIRRVLQCQRGQPQARDPAFRRFRQRGDRSRRTSEIRVHFA